MNKTAAEIIRSKMNSLGISEGEVSRRSNVTQPTVHRIITGASRDPRRSNVLKIAKAIGLSEHDIFYAGNAPATENTTPVANTHGQVPLISSVQAGDFCEAIDLYAPGDAEQWYPCPTAHSSKTYALKVEGQSMEPRFREGEIIMVDPEAPADSGRFVIAKKDSDKSVTFKQLLIDGDNRLLKALNPEWPTRFIELDEHWTVCGVVICKMELL